LPNWCSLNLAGVILIIIGFAIVFLYVTISAVKTKHETKGAGIILIGPFPIIIGTDKESVRLLLVLTIVVIALMVLFLLLSS
jgi:uncharacterized protein (TIGR00304 family)